MSINSSINNDPAVLVAGSLILDLSYKGDDVTKKVAEILNLSVNSSWSVVDHNSEENLALVHYTDGADMDLYGHLRGTLIDLETKKIIADSYGYTPVAVLKQLYVVDGVYSTSPDVPGITDAENKACMFPVEETIIKRCFEGVVMRAIWHKGKIHYPTHRKINPYRSRWGSSKSFLSMYQESGGPDAEQLFDTSKQFSSTCHIFLQVHSALLVGTRQQVKNAYQVYLGNKEYPNDREDNAIGHENFCTNEKISGIVNESYVHKPSMLNIDEANKYLRCGYYTSIDLKDDRQGTGEALIMYHIKDGKEIKMLKIHSPSYEWRSTMRGNNPNINNQFFLLSNCSYHNMENNADWLNFQKRFVLFPLYDSEILKGFCEKHGGIINLAIDSSATANKFSSRESRLHLIWINYIFSLPQHLQSQALGLLNQLTTDKKDLINWLYKFNSDNEDLEKVESYPNTKKIIATLRLQKKSPHFKTYKSNVVNIERYILKGLVDREKGVNLYKLVKEMKTPPRDKQPDIKTTDTGLDTLGNILIMGETVKSGDN